MRITISGKPGSGKSTVTKILSERLGLKKYSIGDFMRDIAKTRGMSLIDLSRIAETDRRIDDELDDRQIRLRNEDNFVINSRLGFHFIPDSIKIYLDVDTKKAAERILKDKREEESAETLDEMEQSINRRIKSERTRYEKYYGVDVDDRKNYDLIIDTSNITASKVADKIIEFVKTI
ncbi:cytidylate kinase family protein [Candidatus Woesearchaeota archaeon]|nr:cytidylate kinase family protein [Candidatus Woesearchaeota archaeon]